MRPSELYQRTPERVDSDLSVLFGCYFNHMPETGINDGWRLAGNNVSSERVQIRYYKDHNYDGRRIWRLASIWFDDEPFMIIQNAGREGDDHSARFITDLPRYMQAVAYVKSILPPRFGDISDVVDEDADIPSLTSFYSSSLEMVGTRLCLNNVVCPKKQIDRLRGWVTYAA